MIIIFNVLITVLLKMLSLQDIHRPKLGSWIGCVSVDESQDWLVSDWVFWNLQVMCISL